MGEYADALVDSMIDSFGWGGRPRPRRSTPKPATCPCCHEAVVYNNRGERMSGGVKHRCPVRSDRPRLDCT